MFLFTNAATSSTPQTGDPAPTTPVASALKSASDATGVSFDYLMRTATRESNLDPSAKARNSSASGLFQFLDQTWLATIKSEGGRLGLSAEQQAISAGQGGQMVVSDPNARQRILALRNDPEVSAKVAGAFTQKNQQTLTERLGRAPSEGELYIAHFLGASGASDLIRLASEAPDAKAASNFPDAAAANRPIFYDRGGRARSAAEVYSVLVQGQSAVPAQAPVELASAASDAPLPSSNDPIGTAYRAKAEPSKPIFGLFRGDAGGPVAQPILNAWSGAGRGLSAASERVAALPSGRFFPRDGAGESQLGTGPSVPDKAPPPVVAVPLPPTKPTLGRATARTRSLGAPLDLLSFLRQRA